jgi:hypothetical protein
LISLALLAVSSDPHLQLVYAVLAGSLAGFLVYNFPPASIFMGDAGSLFMGFFLGAVSVLSSHKATAMATIMIPIIAFSLPLMDMTYAVIRRFYRGLSLGEADREHIHHKLLAKGLSKKKVLFLLYFINGGLLLAVLMLVRRQQNVDFFGLILLAVVAVLGLRLFGYIEFLPFLRDTIRNYEIGRKRKYFNYIIKRFRWDAAKCASMEELKPHLSVLMKEYDIRNVKIYPYVDGLEAPLYVYDNPEDGREPLRQLILSFPVAGGNGRAARVDISREADDEYFLCTAELVRAISDEVGRFL